MRPFSLHAGVVALDYNREALEHLFLQRLIGIVPPPSQAPIWFRRALLAGLNTPRTESSAR